MFSPIPYVPIIRAFPSLFPVSRSGPSPQIRLRDFGGGALLAALAWESTTLAATRALNTPTCGSYYPISHQAMSFVATGKRNFRRKYDREYRPIPIPVIKRGSVVGGSESWVGSVGIGTPLRARWSLLFADLPTYRKQCSPARRRRLWSIARNDPLIHSIIPHTAMSCDLHIRM